MNVIVIQGEDFIRAYENSDDDKRVQSVVKSYRNQKTNGKILVREFETEEEKEAYAQAIEDCKGWNKNYLIDWDEADEIAELLKPSRVYVIREDFHQEDMPSECKFRIFAGVNSYERAIFFLSETANAGDTFQEFLKKENDFRTKNLYWEIEEQTLEMWSAESLDLLKNVQELGRYAEKFGELDYDEREVDYGVTGYYFENKYV